MDGIILLYVPVRDREEAKTMATLLLEEQLIACANIIPGMVSLYRWEGTIQQAEEVLLIVKTTEGKRDVAMKRIEELHSYECPCVTALVSAKTNDTFAKWVFSQVGID